MSNVVVLAAKRQQSAGPRTNDVDREWARRRRVEMGNRIDELMRILETNPRLKPKT